MDEEKGRLQGGPALLQGVTGQASWDEVAGRWVFVPDAAGVASQAYQQTVVALGAAWDEWVVECDFTIRQEGERMVIEF